MSFKSFSDGWIFTTGFKAGVTKLVGDAIHDYKVTNPGSHITAIGCAKWGGVKNRHRLILVDLQKENFLLNEMKFLFRKNHLKISLLNHQRVNPKLNEVNKISNQIILIFFFSMMELIINMISKIIDQDWSLLHRITKRKMVFLL